MKHLEPIIKEACLACGAPHHGHWKSGSGLQPRTSPILCFSTDSEREREREYIPGSPLRLQSMPQVNQIHICHIPRHHLFLCFVLFCRKKKVHIYVTPCTENLWILSVEVYQVCILNLIKICFLPPCLTFPPLNGSKSFREIVPAIIIYSL